MDLIESKLKLKRSIYVSKNKTNVDSLLNNTSFKDIKLSHFRNIKVEFYKAKVSKLSAYLPDSSEIQKKCKKVFDFFKTNFEIFYVESEIIHKEDYISFHTIEKSPNQRFLRILKSDIIKTLKQMSFHDKKKYLQSFNPQNLRLFSRDSRSTGLSINNIHWLLPRTLQRRLLLKNGDYNISSVHINKRSRHYLADFFTTLIDLKWRIDLLIFAATFTFSWLFFGFLWWFISFLHDDFINKDKPDWKPCLKEVHDFRSALLLSIETQQTIGYGFRNVTTNCSIAVITIMIQSCFGLIIQALMTGLIFAKLSRPKKRAQTLMFSKKALICERDNTMCLLFRIADMRKSQIVEAHVRAFMVSKKVTQEGEVVLFHQHNLKLETSDEEGRLFLAWPTTVEHKITEKSPLWDISATDLIHRHFEVVVIMEGIVESTGMTTQARTSYLPSEILWGHRFEQVVSFKPERGQYVVDFAKFNSSTPYRISSLSAKQRFQKKLNNRKNSGEVLIEEETEDEDKEIIESSIQKISVHFEEGHYHDHNYNKTNEETSESESRSNIATNYKPQKNTCTKRKKNNFKTKIPRLKIKSSSRRKESSQRGDLTSIVAAHMASSAFNVIGATSILPSNTTKTP